MNGVANVHQTCLSGMCDMTHFRYVSRPAAHGSCSKCTWDLIDTCDVTRSCTCRDLRSVAVVANAYGTFLSNTCDMTYSYTCRDLRQVAVLLRHVGRLLFCCVTSQL